LNTRALNFPDDLPALLAFVGECNLGSGFCVNPHPGDVRHFISNTLRGADPSRHYWFHFDGDTEPAALGIVYTPRDPAVDVLVRPGLELPDETLSALFDHAEREMVNQIAEAGSTASALGCEVLPCAPERSAFLLARGYVIDEPFFTYSLQTLEKPIPDAMLPPGFSIRPAAGLHEADAIGALHAQAFSSTWSSGEYARVMQSLAFDIDHELLVVAPNGELAAFCICWIDLVSRSGLFEPVGCAPAYRRRGLTRALIVEGMRRMKAEGALTAIVRHAPADKNPAASALYAAVGFEVIGVAVDYRKALAVTGAGEPSPG
jgi:ribosomal protein S18 acetylase RimI-like enzyme